MQKKALYVRLKGILEGVNLLFLDSAETFINKVSISLLLSSLSFPRNSVFLCTNLTRRYTRASIHLTASINSHFFLANLDVFYNPVLTFLPYPKMLLNDSSHQGVQAHE